VISVGVSELRRDLSKLLQRIRDDGETIEIIMRGEPVARMSPIKRQRRSPEEVEKMLAGLDELAAEISK
jgi:prevent-host-death family protein